MAFITDIDKSFALDSSHSYSHTKHPVVNVSKESTEKNNSNLESELQKELGKLKASMTVLEARVASLERNQNTKQNRWFFS